MENSVIVFATDPTSASSQSRVISSDLRRSFSSDAKLGDINVDLETSTVKLEDLLTASSIDHVKKRHELANNCKEMSRLCRNARKIDKNVRSLSEAKLMISTLSSEVELLPTSVNFRAVSPFQTILTS